MWRPEPFTLLVDAHEVTTAPALLAMVAEQIGPRPGVALRVLVTDPAPNKAMAAFGRAAATVGVELTDLPKIAVETIASNGGESAARLDAIVSDVPWPAPWDGVPRYTLGDGSDLGRRAATRASALAVARHLPTDLRLPPGYEPRIPPEYFDDVARAEPEVVHQPYIYPAAAAVARRAGATHLIDIGCGSAEKLLPLGDEFQLLGVDFGQNLQHVRETAPAHLWIEWDAEGDLPLALPRGLVARSVVICSDVVEHMVDPSLLLATLRDLAREAAAVLISTPDRDRMAPGPTGPPVNPSHVREWSLSELDELLRDAGLPPSFSGHMANNTRERTKSTSLAIVEPRSRRELEPAPPGFYVTAILSAYNEADIVEQSILKLIDQAVNVHLVDNWSTDDTVERARGLGLRDRLVIERFPPDQPAQTYEWERLLRNAEEVARRRGGWILHQDVDEVWSTPWPGVSLRDGLWNVQRWGYSAVDFTRLAFHPTDDSFKPGEDFEARFRWFEFSPSPGDLLQVRAWNQEAGAADIASSGGHEAVFAGRRVFPLNFLSKHYPVRSQAHGERKVFAERASRWNEAERARGWHIHYDGLEGDASFIRSPEELHEWTDDFHDRYLTERLTRAGIKLPADGG